MAAPPPPAPPLPNPPPIAQPAPPNDPNVLLPAVPVFPPTVNNVLNAVRYRRDVDVSIVERPPGVRCTLDDHHNAILYEHGIVAQATAVAGPQAAAPPWFHAAMQQLRADIRNDVRADIRADVVAGLRQLTNQRRGDGSVMPFEIVPFATGAQPPNHLPPLHSVNAIENLTGNQLAAYLTGYGVVPLPVGANPHATNRLRKETLKAKVGASAL